jgi:hypothetical protein
MSNSQRDYNLVPDGFCLCHKCENVFELSNFYPTLIRKNGYEGICKSCHTSKVKEWQGKNKERIASTKRRYNMENLVDRMTYISEWQRQNRDKVSEYNRKAYLRRKNAKLLTE